MCGPASSETAESEPHSGHCQCSEQQGERFDELAAIFSRVQLCVYSLCLVCLLWRVWTAPVPSCADVRGTFPSAWTSAQLSRMSQDDLKRCVEVFAQDASMSPEQRRALWLKLRQVGGGLPRSRPVTFYLKVCSCCFCADSRPSARWDSWGQISCCLWALWWQRWVKGSFTTSISLTQQCWHTWVPWQTGALKRYHYKGDILQTTVSTRFSFPSQMRAVISGVLRRRKLKVEQLTAVDLATFCHLICGLYPSEMKRVSAHNLRSDNQLHSPGCVVVSL